MPHTTPSDEYLDRPKFNEQKTSWADDGSEQQNSV